tara:strand:+ start:811 stop:1740 length:930 start_codon:yes stop_codon:yes gene_type:complete
MNDNFKISFLIVLFFSFGFCSAISNENKILFKINNEIITTVDVVNEIKYLKIFNEKLNNIEQKKLYEISKNSIIREKLKKIELSKYFEKIEIEEKYMENIISNFYKKRNFENFQSFKKFVLENNLSIAYIEKKITIESIWNQLIFEKYMNDIKINRDEIKKNIIKNNIQNEYLISEIVFNLKTGETLNEKFQIIKSDIDKESFETAALLHSVSQTANQSGKVGWIKENSLNAKIKLSLSKIEKGFYTDPIVVPGGFIILKINDKKIANVVDNIEDEIEFIVKTKTQEQLNQFSNMYLNKIQKNTVINAL